MTSRGKCIINLLKFDNFDRKRVRKNFNFRMHARFENFEIHMFFYRTV